MHSRTIGSGKAHEWGSRGQKTIETKTRTFDGRHVARVQEMANWLRARRRRWCPHGALAVLCVVHARRLQRVEAGVLIVSLDQLVEALRTAAGARERPRFLAGLAPPSTEEDMRERYGDTLGLAGGRRKRRGAVSTGAGRGARYVHDETREPGFGHKWDRHLGRR